MTPTPLPSTTLFSLVKRLRIVRNQLDRPQSRGDLGVIAMELVTTAHDVHHLEGDLRRLHVAFDPLRPPPPPETPTNNGSPT